MSDGANPRFNTTLPEPYASALQRLSEEKRRTTPDMIRIILIDELERRGFVRLLNTEGADNGSHQNDQA